MVVADDKLDDGEAALLEPREKLAPANAVALSQSLNRRRGASAFAGVVAAQQAQKFYEPISQVDAGARRSGAFAPRVSVVRFSERGSQIARHDLIGQHPCQ